MAFLIAMTTIASCSDSEPSSEPGTDPVVDPGIKPVTTKDFNDLMEVLKEMEKKGEIASLKQGINVQTKKPCATFFVLQPIDHNNTNWSQGVSDSMWQRVSIVAYSGDNAPTVLNTNGYDMPSKEVECVYPDIAKLLNSNLIEVEHRFCGQSVPEKCDWQYNNAMQQSADLNAIITLLKSKGMFNGKWVASGVSKSGMTTTFLAMYYPEACDLYVPFCAPFCDNLKDMRCATYLMQTCYKNHPQTVKDQWERNWQFIEDLLQNKPVLQEVLKFNLEYLLQKYPDSQFEEYHNLCYLVDYFFESQFGKAMYFRVSDWAKYIPESPKNYVPGDTKEDKDYLDYLRKYCYLDYDTLSAWGVVTKADKMAKSAPKALRTKGIVMDDNQSVSPYFMQCVFELGRYIMDFSRIKPYLTEKQYAALQEFADPLVREPYAKYRSQFKAITPSLKKFLKTAKSKIIFVYGEDDPYTGAGMTAEDISGNSNLKLFIVPDGVHNDNFLDANYSSDPTISSKITQAIREVIQ